MTSVDILRSLISEKDELLIIDEADSNTTYICFAELGSLSSEAVWKIKKISTNGNITTVTYADGNSNYDNIADNRTSLNYS